MWHLKKFTDNAEYREYISSDQVWLPRVAYILNSHVESLDNKGNDANGATDDWDNTPDTVNNLPKGGNNGRWIDYILLKKHFIEVANNGTMYFTDIQDVSTYDALIARGESAADASAGSWYRASYNSENGTIVITTPAGKAVLNESTSELEFINFPNDYTAYGGPMPN
jgi:hypothetical protein